jgi:hypothetical protein
MQIAIEYLFHRCFYFTDEMVANLVNLLHPFSIARLDSDVDKAKSFILKLQEITVETHMRVAFRILNYSPYPFVRRGFGPPGSHHSKSIQHSIYGRDEREPQQPPKSGGRQWSEHQLRRTKGWKTSAAAQSVLPSRNAVSHHNPAAQGLPHRLEDPVNRRPRFSRNSSPAEPAQVIAENRLPLNAGLAGSRWASNQIPIVAGVQPPRNTGLAGSRWAEDRKPIVGFRSIAAQCWPRWFSLGW